MYQDYKGFVHADFNGHINGGGYFSLEDYVKSKIGNIDYTEFIGINIAIAKGGHFSSFAVVKRKDDELLKFEIPELNEKILQEAFNGIDMMIYDKNVNHIKRLEELHILGTLPIHKGE